MRPRRGGACARRRHEGRLGQRGGLLRRAEVRHGAERHAQLGSALAHEAARQLSAGDRDHRWRVEEVGGRTDVRELDEQASAERRTLIVLEHGLLEHGRDPAQSLG